MKRRIVEVGDLPEIAFSHRDPMWWANVLLIAVEGTMLVLLALSYFYVRDRMTPWPPDPVPRSIAWIATVELAILIASAIPTARAERGAEEGDVVGMRRGMIGLVVFGVAAGACRWLLFESLPVRWDAHAYGSVVWTMLGFQTAHGLTGLVEAAVLVALLFRGPIEQKHRVDVSVNRLLWYFVIAGAALQWVVVFLELLTTEVA